MSKKNWYVPNYTKLRFVLSIKDHIIVARFIRIDNFNKEKLQTKEFGECINRITLSIINDLDIKTEKYLKEHKYVATETTESIEHYLIEIQYNDVPLVQGYISANKYPQHIKYNVDIKPLLPNIIKDLKKSLEN